MPKLFESVRNVNPGRSVFNLSYEKKFTCDMGELIPVMCDEMVPGDVFSIGNQAMIRFQPMVAPMLHEVNMYTHYYFVPYRLLWDLWESFITGGRLGDDASVLPRWNPSNTAVGSLWDYLGLPTGIVPTDALPLDFIRSAYNFIYNEYYRNQNLIDEIALTSEVIQKRSWEKDYFVSALPFQQRGTTPALPITGSSTAVFPSAITLSNQALVWPAVSTLGGNTAVNVSITNQQPYAANDKTAFEKGKATVVIPKASLDDNTVNLGSAFTFTVSDLRLAFQIQKWLERNARAGARYTEFLKAHYGVAPRDDRLDRPEYIGGTKSPIVISEVLKTSTDGTSALGTMAGHGLGFSNSFVGKYHAQEFGLIMGIMSIMPKPGYQQGIDRQWLRRTKYDFYSPEFANLSEQAIERAEIFVSNVGAENRTLFGYQGRYDEMRVKRNLICGDMRSTFNYWHMGRIFGSAPLLNQSFIECVPDKRNFAVTTVDEVIVSFGNVIKAVRPLPSIAEPGLIDHV